MKKIRVALVGYGYWGPNLARNIVLNRKYELVAVVDQDEKRRRAVESTYGVITFNSYLDIDDSLDIQLVIICTRPSSHVQLAKHFLESQINVLVTKPCGLSSAEATELADMADANGVKIFCDFTYHFSPLINFVLQDPVAQPIVKAMREYNSYRTALGIVQSDVDVLADLAVHDIYILLLLKGTLPITVQCLRTNSSSDQRLLAAFSTLVWEDGFIGTIHVSWNSPKKVRLISITSEDRGILLEEMNREAPVQLLQFAPTDSDYAMLTAEEKYSRNVSFTMGNLEVPNINMYEALALEVEAIAAELNTTNSTSAIPNARNAADVWKVVEALRLSNQMKGVTQYVQ